MNCLQSRWIAITLPAAVLVLTAPASVAFSDSNADLKEAEADRSTRIVTVGRSAPVAQTAWVPTPAKRLDSFKPVLPPQRSTALAQVQAPASAGR